MLLRGGAGQARSASTTRELWHFAPPDVAIETPLISDGVVSVPNYWGVLCEFDERTGALLASIDLHADITANYGNADERSELAAGDGLLLVSVADGFVALHAASSGEVSAV